MLNKYRVPMVNADICGHDKDVEVNGISATNAMDIANTFNKGFTTFLVENAHKSLACGMNQP